MHRSATVTGRSPHRASLLLVAVALVASACGPASSTSLSAQGLSRASDGWYGLPLSVERSLPDTVLRSRSGAAFTLSEELVGTPTLLFFGYTSCPDICPIHLAAIASAMQQTRTTYERLQVVFVSVDPERDTPERIDEFLRYFNPRMIGLHGDLEDVVATLAELDLPGPVVEGADPRGDGVLIGHPAQVIGFDAAGNARRVWPFGTRRVDWVSDIPRIVSEWS